MSNKSAAQIRRMLKRAQQRGETYEIPTKKPPVAPLAPPSDIEITQGQIAKVLQQKLNKIEKNVDGLNSKDKRTAKRKAEAIALEEIQTLLITATASSNISSNVSNNSETKDESKIIKNTEELLSWYKANQGRLSSHLKKKKQQREYTTSSSIGNEDQTKLNAYTKYKQTISTIESNIELNAKDRRSAKRKADAIACEESKFDSIQQLCDWYDSNPELQHLNKKGKKKKQDGNNKANPYPYILFIGQIPFTATKEDIYTHFQKYVGKKEITKDTMKIRIPQEIKGNDKDKKNKSACKNNDKQKSINNQEYDNGENDFSNSYDFDDDEEYLGDYYGETEEKEKDESKIKHRGFAFAEFNDPKLMFECLKLHHTDLNGRRINVIRSVGGGKEARKRKHETLKKEQDEYISLTVDKIVNDYISKGLLKEGELDNGAISLCKRRSAATVDAALQQYIEQRAGKELENPSSFFTKVICDITEEGQAGTQSFNKKRKAGGTGGVQGGGRQNTKKQHKGKSESKSFVQDNDILGASSILANKHGVDMSLSHKKDTMSSIFPSMSRGRGRGRGAYMNSK